MVTRASLFCPLSLLATQTLRSYPSGKMLTCGPSTTGLCCQLFCFAWSLNVPRGRRSDFRPHRYGSQRRVVHSHQCDGPPGGTDPLWGSTQHLCLLHLSSVLHVPPWHHSVPGKQALSRPQKGGCGQCGKKGNNQGLNTGTPGAPAARPARLAWPSGSQHKLCIPMEGVCPGDLSPALRRKEGTGALRL